MILLNFRLANCLTIKKLNQIFNMIKYIPENVFKKELIGFSSFPETWSNDWEIKQKYISVCSPQMTQKTESLKDKECVWLDKNSSDSLSQHAVFHTNLSFCVTLEIWLLPRQCGTDMVYQSCSLFTSLTISSLPPSPSALPCLSTELTACLLSHSLLIGLWDWSQYWFWQCCTHPSSPEMLVWRAHCFLTSLFPCKMGNC